ncbi:MAG: 2-oxo acid dehydrogenase subunit E2 [Pseudomonadota bacterium]
MARVQIDVPDIGGSEGAEVIEILVAPGDTVDIDQGLIVLESDKASMEIPSTIAGTVVELLVAEGDELVEGSPMVVVDASDAAGEADTAAQAAGSEDAVAETGGASADTDKAELDREQSAPQSPTPQPVTPEPTVPESATPPTAKPVAASGAEPTLAVEDHGDSVYAGPAVRKLAREFGVPLAAVAGSGPHGRILKEDLHGFVKNSLGAGDTKAGGALPKVPDVDFAQFGEVEITERSKLDKLTAANMQRSWLNVPHVTQFDDADITELEAFRKSLKADAEGRGTKLTPVPFILKACAVALKTNPKLNSSLSQDGQVLVYKKYVHIGMAVDTPAGLVVPVLRDVDRKGIWELAAEVQEMAALARERKLKPQDMQGGCFTISSLGSIGGRGFTPIVNPPEVAILGVSKAAVQPVWDGEQFTPRTLMPLTLSYDHRVVNGGDAGRFLTGLVALLSDTRRLSL